MKTKEKVDFITVNITPDRKRFCNVCGQELLKDYSCGKCGIYYQPQEARHEVSIKGLDGREPGPQPRTIPIAFIDTTIKPNASKGKLFDSLEKKGYRFTSYADTNV